MKLSYVCLTAAFPALMLAQNVPTAAADSAPLTVSGKLYYHYQKVYSPFSIIESGFQAAILQWNDDPREWGQGYHGFWRRTASTVGYDTTRNLFMFTLDSITRQDPRYYRAGEGSISSRTRHAFKQTFLGHTDGGKKTLPFVRFAATYGVAFLANSWNPDRLSDNRHAVVRGTVTLAADAGNNIFDEFWPDLKRKFFHRKNAPAGVIVKTH
jgi:hypothetical protein